ncbi:hypothetical protein EVAR_103237_1 [Eumeta japonica]|uniref:Uncharacterized protein n=1 Tax=Eumeta variegata TaxID=151549 RepID=A0A4C1X682_EUMVA|nr:hypothetical protein EVAR_103237_1 [Eumeta japonica]
MGRAYGAPCSGAGTQKVVTRLRQLPNHSLNYSPPLILLKFRAPPGLRGLNTRRVGYGLLFGASSGRLPFAWQKTFRRIDSTYKGQTKSLESRWSPSLLEPKPSMTARCGLEAAEECYQLRDDNIGTSGLTNSPRNGASGFN